MPVVRVKGFSNPISFPDDMEQEYIRDILVSKFPRLPKNTQTIEPVNKSLMENVGQKISDYLFDKGIISDRYGAQRIGQNLSLALGFTPAGVAYAGDEFGKAVKENDYLGAALASTEILPVGDMAIFAGALAKNADLNMLEKAKKMFDKGSDRDEIWKETGWFNDKGDWKFEIDDSAALLIGKGFDDEAYSKTGGVFDHNRLYENYPDAAGIDTSLKSGDTGGSYTPYIDRGVDEFPQFEEISVDRGLMPARQSTLLHELQHAIQNREGFATGGSPHISGEVVEEMRGRLYAPINQKIKQIENSKEFDHLVDKYMASGDRLRKAIAKAESELGIEDLEAQRMEIARYIDKISRSEGGYSIDNFKVYQRLAGEAEARLVQKRMNLTPEERRARPPWYDLDVPEDELIYRKDSGVNMSQDLAMDKASRMKRAREQGFKDNLYHGTTHDFTEFKPDRLTPESHFGAGYYFSNKVEDVNKNYAGRGADLTNRIDRRAEEIANELDLEYDDPEVIRQAVSEMQGHEGMVMPASIDKGNTFDLRGSSATRLKYEREIPDWKDYLDDAGGDEDVARELALDESYYNEPEGELADFMESLRRQSDEYGFDADELLGEIEQAALDYEGITSYDLDRIMRNTEWYAEDEAGNLINNEVYRQAIEDAGFDSIVHRANEDFPSMDIPSGTEHTIIFDPKRIRSTIGAKFDPKNLGKPSILGGAGALGLYHMTQQNKDDNKG